MLLLVTAVLASAIVLLGRKDEEDSFEEIERQAEEAYLPPELKGLSAAEREAILARRREDERRKAEREKAARQPPPPTTPQALLSGVVRDAASGEPIENARVWLEDSGGPCPRMPHSRGLDSDKPRGDPTASSGKDGRFSIRLRGPAPGHTMDVFALADGYVLYVECAVPLPGETEIRLAKGLSIAGTVTRPGGRPVEGAVVSARPAPETPPGPGHATPALTEPTTQADGAFTLTGFLPGPVLVEVDHPRYMPASIGPIEPGVESLEVILVPALLARFEIRTDDGRPPEHPTVVWTTTENPPRTEVMLLPVETEDAEGMRGNDGEIKGGPVRIPCDALGVILQVRADGYGTWTSDPLRLPPEGGEETYQIKLTGDLSTGRIRVSLEDEMQEKVSVMASDVHVKIGRRDPGIGAAAYVLRQGEDLEITDLPAGRYELTLLSTKFAPVVLEVVVTPGQETHETARVRSPAKVRIRVTGTGETLIPFEIQGGGKRVSFVPEGSYEEHTDEATGQSITVAGPDGLLASGLAAGTYSIVITSTEVYAPPTVVQLVEGETEEVEISVQPR